MESENGKIYYGVGLDNSQIKRDANETKRIIHGIGTTAETEGQRIDDSLKNIGKAVAGYFAVDQLKDFASKVATVRGEFQQLELAFTTMLGSADKADSLMSQLIHTAATTPFGVQDVANGAKQLIAYGVAANEVNDTLIRLGDIASGLSIPLGDLVMLYGTTMTQGRLFTQDLRQFMGRGIPLADELAKQFGVTKDKVGELVTAGKVGFPQVKKAIEDLTNEGSKFGGLMEAQSHTITGQISNIEDAIDQMFNSIGKQSEGLISDTLGVVSNLIENWQTVGKVLLTVIAAYGTYKAAVIAVAAAHKIAAVWGEVQAFLALAKGVTTAKDAMLLFNMAVEANPLGIVLGVLAAAATAFSLFSTKTDEATQMSTKFGEKAATQISRVNTLTTAINGLEKGSSTYKKATEELNGILQEYGVSQVTEADNIEQVNQKRAEAIELIKTEAVERERLNQLETGNDTYNQALTDAQSQLEKDLRNSVFNTTGDSLLNKLFGDSSELQKNAAAISTIVAQVVEQNINLIANKTGEEYDKGIDEIYKKIQDRMRRIGLSENTISKQWVTDNLFSSRDIINTYINSVQAATEEHDRYTTAVNKSADAEREAASGAMTFSQKVNAVAKGLQAPNDGVHELYQNIKNLMSQYSDNTIGFTIRIGGEVPKWMSTIKIPKLQRLARYFSALGSSMKNGQTVSVNGKRFTKQQALQRGADYATAAEQAQTAVDEKKQQEEADKKEREREAKARAREAKQQAEEAKRQREEAAREKQRIADETAERNKEIAAYGESVKQQEEETQLDLRQQNINLLEDGYEKEKEQIDLNYDRLISENKKRRDEWIEQLKDNKVREWLNSHPKASKSEQDAYRSSLNLTEADLSDKQQAGLAEYEKIANETRIKAYQDLANRLTSEYQNFEQRKTSINEEYDKKRKELEALPPDTKGREEAIAELEKKRKEALKEVSDEEYSEMKKNSSLLVSLFTDASEMSDKEIRKVINETQSLLDYLKNTKAQDLTPNFGFTAEQLEQLQNSPERLKDITEQLNKLKAAARQGNPFKQLAEDISELFKKSKEAGKDKSLESKLKNLGNSAASCADIIGGVTSKLSEMFEAAGKEDAADAMDSVSDAMTTVSNIGKGFAQGGLVGGIAAAAGEAIGYVTKAFQASARHAAALKKIQKEVTEQQRAYNLALYDQNLEYERAATVFGDLDYTKAANAVNVLRQAYSDLNAELRGTEEQQEKFSGKNLGWFQKLTQQLLGANNSLKQTYAGLADIQIVTGHKKTGLFGWGKGKDTYSSILEVYPELIDKQGNFNRELAESILNARTFKGEGKEALQYMIDLYDKAKEAEEQLKDYLSNIFGDLGNTMSDALVDAFKNGSDAADAFGDKVSEMLENIGKQMIFTTLFSDIIEQANDKMLETMKNQSLSEEEKFNEYINILDAMTTGILGQQTTYNALMEKYKQMAASKGIDIFAADSEEEERTGTSKGIATASQESVDELNGRATAIQGHTYNISENSKTLVENSAMILRSVMNIEGETSGMKNRIETMQTDIKAVRSSVEDIALKGVKMR